MLNEKNDCKFCGELTYTMRNELFFGKNLCTATNGAVAPPFELGGIGGELRISNDWTFGALLNL